MTRQGAAGVLLIALVGMSACSTTNSVVVRPPAPTPPGSATTSIPATTSPSSTGARVQQITVSPSTGLTSGQRVQVSGSGFSPNESLIVTECADKGASTGPGDCNLAGVLSTTSDVNGNVQTGLTVVKGPFGANQIVCGAPLRCLVSVSQETLSPTEEADAPISFK